LLELYDRDTLHDMRPCLTSPHRFAAGALLAALSREYLLSSMKKQGTDTGMTAHR
jgi:hypothetical protein